MGHLPQGKKQVNFLLMAIDYFTKWVETEAFAIITEAKIQNSCGRTSYASSGYVRRSSSTMVVSSTTKVFSLSAQTLASRTNFPPQGILKPMVKQK